MANNWYISSGQYTAVAQWQNAHAFGAGSIVRQLAAPAIGNERCFRTTAGGTSGGSEPVWNLGFGATTTDNTITWVEVTGQQAFQAPAPGKWAAPHARLNNAMTWGGQAEGDTYYLDAQNHAEARTDDDIKFQAPGSSWLQTQVISVSSAAGSHIPPLATDWLAGASIQAGPTGGHNIVFNDPSNNVGMYYNGVNFITGHQYSNGGQGDHVLEACTLGMLAGSDAIKVGAQFNFTLRNCIFNNGDATSHASAQGTVTVDGGSFSATIPNPTWWNVAGGGIFTLRNFDASGLGSTRVVNLNSTGGVAFLDRCRLASNTPVIGITGNDGAQDGQMAAYVTRCQNGTDNNYHAIFRGFGNLQSSRLLYRTGGASDDSGPFGHVIQTNQNANNNQITQFYYPFEGYPLYPKWENTVGVPVTTTIFGIASGTLMPTNANVWVAVEYPGATTSPLGSVTRTRPANSATAATTLTADTVSGWAAGATPRVSGAAATIGQIFSVPSNTSQLFYVVSGAGTLAGTLPAGYATVLDGGTVADGGFIVQAMWRFSILATITPQLVGPLSVTPLISSGSITTTTIIDPAPTVLP